jgi:hypothetical protein
MHILEESPLLSLMADERCVKIIAATDKDGIAHVAPKQSLHIDDEGNFRYFELLEYSGINKALTYCLWFGRQLSVLLVNISEPDRAMSFEIKATPIRALITGDEFEAAYRSVRDKLGGKADLSTVWVIRPDGIRDLRYEIQRESHDARHPFTAHLDRLVRTEAYRENSV